MLWGSKSYYKCFAFVILSSRHCYICYQNIRPQK